jgi:hypothetical protein
MGSIPNLTTTNMNREFKIKLNDGDSEDLLIPYLQAEARERFLFELFHNFFKRWDNDDAPVDIDEVKEKLYELKSKYRIILKEE